MLREQHVVQHVRVGEQVPGVRPGPARSPVLVSPSSTAARRPGSPSRRDARRAGPRPGPWSARCTARSRPPARRSARAAGSRATSRAVPVEMSRGGRPGVVGRGRLVGPGRADAAAAERLDHRLGAQSGQRAGTPGRAAICSRWMSRRCAVLAQQRSSGQAHAFGVTGTGRRLAQARAVRVTGAASRPAATAGPAAGGRRGAGAQAARGPGPLTGSLGTGVKEATVFQCLI